MKITNLHKNIMGTASFDGQSHGMRKPQDFIVYPMQDSGTQIKIQSEHRYGIIDLATGKGVLSAHRAQYANSVWLQQCFSERTHTSIELTNEDSTALKAFINSTAGLLVGTSFVKCENIGAFAI